MNFVICTEAMDSKVRFSGTVAEARVAAQNQANIWGRHAKIVYADNPPNSNPLVQSGVNPNDVKVERFTPAGVSPTFTSLTPATGSIAGGTAVTFKGSRVDQGATFVLGGTPVTNLKRVDSETYTFTTTAQTAGAKSLVITNPDATTITQASAFTYA